MKFKFTRMAGSLSHSRSRTAGLAAFAWFVALLFAVPVAVEAQAVIHEPPPDEAAKALFTSDIHFDPFLDPGKVSTLAAAKLTEWKNILSTPPSPDRSSRYAALQKECPTRGEDTSFALLESSMEAIKRDAQGAAFITVSGDLLAHSFDCKYGVLFPRAKPEAYRAFVEETIAFVLDQLRAALPGVPVFVALGNNDSDCGDYKLDAHSLFLQAVGKEVTEGFPPQEREAARQTFAAGGYYSVRLPAPVLNARLLVLNDVFLSRSYQTCDRKHDPTSGEAQLDWLEGQLALARSKHESVWVMAHIPPGVDLYSSAKEPAETCGAKGPKMFLASERLANILAASSDVVKLAIFAHTHMDETRLLNSGAANQGSAPAKGVPLRLVPSISPINRNAPSFTVARMNAATAVLQDFSVVAASNGTGVGTTWQEEYDWQKTYHQQQYSASGVSQELAEFESDPSAQSQSSLDYISGFYVGTSKILGLVWRQYVCSLKDNSAAGFKACACPAGLP